MGSNINYDSQVLYSSRFHPSFKFNGCFPAFRYIIDRSRNVLVFPIVTLLSPPSMGPSPSQCCISFPSTSFDDTGTQPKVQQKPPSSIPWSGQTASCSGGDSGGNSLGRTFDNSNHQPPAVPSQRTGRRGYPFYVSCPFLMWHLRHQRRRRLQ